MDDRALRAARTLKAPAAPPARSRFAVLALFLPALVMLGLDVLRRAPHLATFDRPHAAGYAGSVLLSAITWAALLATAARHPSRVGRALGSLFFVSLYTLALGVQSAFFGTWSIYCGYDANIEHIAFFGRFTCALPWGAPSLLALYLPVAALAATGMVAFARRTDAVPMGVARFTPVIAIAGVFTLVKMPASYRGYQSSSADHIWLNGIHAAAVEHQPFGPGRRVRAQRRDPTPIPPLTRAAGPARNVILVLQETTRRDAVCFDPSAPCDRPGSASHAVLPDRLALSNMRSVASSTIISMSVLLSGYAPTESFETMHSAPYLWQYAKAAGYSTAYWTSQHVMLFGMRFVPQDQPLDVLVVGTHLDLGANGDAGADDALLVDRVIAELPSLPEPFFAVVQLANVHYPYAFDRDTAPYPAEAEGTAAAEMSNYRNAVHASDLQMARLLESVRDAPLGDRTVVVFTSDHGEAFWEHGVFGHTKSVLDEEILVPAWIWGRALGDSERENIARAKDAPTFHLDLAPTMLDLMGLWDLPAIAEHRAKMPGHPLTRPERTTGPVALTNCSWIWQCEHPSIGMMDYPLKLSARGRETSFSCFDVVKDPEEQDDLGEAACSRLVDLAHETFGFMPADVPQNGNPPR